MPLALVLSVGVQQQVGPTKLAPEIVKTPSLEVATNPEFHQAVRLVEERLAAKDFAGAKAKLQLLPKSTVNIDWDDSKIPIDQRQAFTEARNRALQGWEEGTTIHFKIVGQDAGNVKPDLKIDFNSVLALIPGTNAPRGLAVFFSNDAHDPRCEAVIGLKRGSPLSSSSLGDIQNDVAYAIGQYLGLSGTPLVDGYMYRQEIANARPAAGRSIERVFAEHNMDLVAQLRDAVNKHNIIAPGDAKSVVDPAQIKPTARISQGTQYPIQIQVTNVGTVPLQARLIPDCGCFSQPVPLSINPGDTNVIHVSMNTLDYGGQVNKELFLLTNDPEHPVQTIPVHVNVAPRYRFIFPDGKMTLVNPEGKMTIYMVEEGEPLKADDVIVEGGEAETVIEPWHGVLADPELHEAARERKGYKFNIDLKKLKVDGLTTYALVVDTKDPVFKKIRTNFYGQKGILVQPQQLFMGTLNTVPRTFEVTLSQPKAFHILKTICDDSHFKIKVSSEDGNTIYTLKVTYDGKARSGDYEAQITVLTDNPAERKIVVPLRATID